MSKIICTMAAVCKKSCTHKVAHEPNGSNCMNVYCSATGEKALCVPIENLLVKAPLVGTQLGTYSMSKDELFALHTSTTAACLEVMKKKNHDYTSGGSVFANFKDSSILGIPPVMGILLRCIDKFKRIQTFCNGAQLAVEGEGVLDAIDDVINYMILAKGIIVEEQKQKELNVHTIS